VVFPTGLRAAVHFDLAEDLLKTVLFRLVAAGFDLVAWTDEEFVIEVKNDRQIQEKKRQIEEIAGLATGEILEGIPAPCEVRAAPSWWRSTARGD
jgi:hypothetical protein